MPIYMDFDGVKGDVTAKGHEKWIEIHSFQWGVGRAISTPVGSSANREASSPSVSEITITKVLETSSPGLLGSALHGAAGKTVKIDFLKTEKGQLEVFLKYVLSDTMISGFSVSSGGDRPSESLSLNFTKIEVTSTGAKPDGSGEGPVTVFYDLSKAQVG